MSVWNLVSTNDIQSMLQVHFIENCNTVWIYCGLTCSLSIQWLGQCRTAGNQTINPSDFFFQWSNASLNKSYWNLNKICGFYLDMPFCWNLSHWLGKHLGLCSKLEHTLSKLEFSSWYQTKRIYLTNILNTDRFELQGLSLNYPL